MPNTESTGVANFTQQALYGPDGRILKTRIEPLGRKFQSSSVNVEIQVKYNIFTQTCVIDKKWVLKSL